MEEKGLSTNDLRIYYEIAYGSPWLVFLHGVTTNHTFFNVQLRYFEGKGNGVVGIDQRGDGKSYPKPSLREFYSLEGYTSDLEKIVLHEQIQQPIILGHSMGGMVAVNYAARNQANTRGLVLIDTSYNFKKTLTPSATLFYLFKSLFRKYFSHLNKSAQKKGIEPEYLDFSGLGDVSDTEFARMTYEKAIPDDVPAMHAASEAILEWNIEEQLQKIKAPTLIINAGKSQFIRPSTAYELQERIGKDKSKAIILPSVKHQLVIQQPERITLLIENFLYHL